MTRLQSPARSGRMPVLFVGRGSPVTGFDMGSLSMRCVLFG